MTELKAIKLPESYNYCAAFLTLSCNLTCSYCINNFGLRGKATQHLTGEQWVEALNRLESRPDLPITLQGGEPSLHKDFLYILNNIKDDLNIDILTNLQFDADEFIAHIDPNRIKRDSPYASIRVSYHPQVMELVPLADKVLKLQKAGFSIGIWSVQHPSQDKIVREARQYCLGRGIDFRFKEFLGEYDDKLYGEYLYEGACDKRFKKDVLCKTTELIMGPDGSVYRCHSDLYESRAKIGNIGEPQYNIKEVFIPCAYYGHCNPCDIKIKTNRLQEYGHTSVQIKFNDGTTPAKNEEP